MCDEKELAMGVLYRIWGVLIFHRPNPRTNQVLLRHIMDTTEDDAPITLEGQHVIVILDKASLEIVKTKTGDFTLLNCDDHISLMKKFNKDPADFRPDIIHQELMAILDSPLNKANRVKVYIHTEKNVLIEVNPKTRIPRTLKLTF
jgi:hypothetical protein